MCAETETATVRLGDRTGQGYRPATLETRRGPIQMRWYETGGHDVAVIYVGGVAGDFDTPAHGLYPRLCTELLDAGISGLRVQFRDSTDLDEAVFDILAGVAFLEHHGATRLGLVGHSFGGAAVIQAGAVAGSVQTVVTLSTQSYGANLVVELAPDCSILLVHGADDQVLDASSSETLFETARGRKELRVLAGGSHSLDEVTEDVHSQVRDWLVKELTG